jgi:hypothetical protein
MMLSYQQISLSLLCPHSLLSVRPLARLAPLCVRSCLALAAL